MIGLIVLCVVLVGLLIYSRVQLGNEKAQKKIVTDELTAKMGVTTAQLETQLAQLTQLEQSAGTTRQDLQTAKQSLEAKSDELQTLRDAVVVLESDKEVKTAELAEARKAIFEANDYILDRHIGSDKTELLRLRRIRDLMLLNLASVRKYGCLAVKRRPEFDRIKKELQLLISVTPEQWKVYNATVKEGSQLGRVMIYTQEDSDIQAMNTLITDAVPEAQLVNESIKSKWMIWVGQSTALWIFPLTAREKLDEVIRQLQTTGTGIRGVSFDNSPLIPIPQFGSRGTADVIRAAQQICTRSGRMPRFDRTMRSLSSMFGFNEVDVMSLVDEVETLIMNLQKKACPDGVPDYAAMEKLLIRFVDLLCDESNEAGVLLSKPIDYTLAKSVSLFQ